MVERTWDAQSYHRVSGPMVEMARDVLDRLPLRGDETVLDAGCGSGLVTELLCERLPSGRVVAVDADPAMVEKAREHLRDRADVRLVDLVELEMDEPFDAIFSTATFHWIPDHDRLFARLFAALRPGGRLVAQCGGRGNLERLLAAADQVAEREPYASHIAHLSRRGNFPDPGSTTRRLAAAGFVDIDCRLVGRIVTPDDAHEYLTTINLGRQVQALPDGLAPRYVDDVIAVLGEPVEIDYVRLDIDAVRPA
ncbi:MAG TPA: methyltransferase domain-containing protein [Actinomycetota bacterium]|nr:methyltransferase domain-containing protein [Actinomycetota bacterium]